MSGPLLDGSGASGVIVHGGQVIAQWGDVTVPEMLFSATKSVLSAVAGVAFDHGLLPDLDTPVVVSIELPVLSSTAHGRAITWKHLLQQTSQWNGELWGKPTRVDAQSRREGDEPEGGPPGSGWAYNDVRVDLVALALTVLLRRSLPEVLREHIMDPLGASSSWSWHGYTDSVVDVGERPNPSREWWRTLGRRPVDVGRRPGPGWPALFGEWRAGRPPAAELRVDRSKLDAVRREAQLRSPVVDELRPQGCPYRSRVRQARARQWRQAPVVDRPSPGSGDRLALGR